MEQDDGLRRITINGPFLGMDTTSNILSMPKEAFRLAENIDIEFSGAASKRMGYTNVLTTAWPNRRIRKGINYKFGNPLDTQVVVFGHQTADTTGQLGRISAGAITSILSGLNNVKPSLVAFNNLLFFYNGFDDFLYNGTTTRQIGIDPPTNAPTNGGATPGSLVAGAVYSFAYTYYNSVTGAESSPSPVLGGVTGSTGYIIGVTPGDPATADTIRLYRSVDGGTVLFLDNTGPIAAVSINSTQADAGLGKEIEIDNTRPSVYGLFPYANVLNSRVGLTGDLDIPNRVHFSAIYTEGAHPESFPVTHFSDCESSRGRDDINVGLGKANESWIVLKTHTVGRIEQIGSNDVSSSQDGVLFDYKELSDSVGAVGHNSQTNVYGSLVWLDRDNIYLSNGTSVNPIATRISKSLREFNFTDFREFSSFNDEENKRVYFTCKKSITSAQPDLVIVGQYFDYPEFKWTLYTDLSIGDYFLISETNEVYAGSLDSSGQIYKINDGNTDAGTFIEWQLITAPYEFNQQEENKLYTKVILLVQGSGDPYQITAKSIYNINETPIDDQPICLESEGATWDADDWDVGLWTGEAQIPVNYYIHRRAFAYQLVLEDTDSPSGGIWDVSLWDDADWASDSVDEPFTLYGFTVLARNTSLIKANSCD